MENEAVYTCDTCQDTGEVDETLGAAWEAHADPHAPCPDCIAPKLRAMEVMLAILRPIASPPPPCICKQFGRLRLVNLNCGAHGARVSPE